MPWRDMDELDILMSIVAIGEARSSSTTCSEDNRDTAALTFRVFRPRLNHGEGPTNVNWNNHQSEFGRARESKADLRGCTRRTSRRRVCG